MANLQWKIRIKLKINSSEAKKSYQNGQNFCDRTLKRIWRSADRASRYILLQGDSKRWTQLKSKRRLNTRQTVGCGISSSLLALQVDLRGLRSKLSWVRLTFSSDTRGRPELLPLSRQTICSNWWFQRQMLSSLDVECWSEDKTHAARQLATQFKKPRTQNNLTLHSSHFALNWRCRTDVR